MASEEPGSSQMYALQTRKHIAALRRAKMNTTIEISVPLPRSLAHLKREITGKKWAEARRCAGGQTSKKKHAVRDAGKPEARQHGCG